MSLLVSLLSLRVLSIIIAGCAPQSFLVRTAERLRGTARNDVGRGGRGWLAVAGGLTVAWVAVVMERDLWWWQRETCGDGVCRWLGMMGVSELWRHLLVQSYKNKPR